MFIGRERELAALNKLYASDKMCIRDRSCAVKAALAEREGFEPS